MQICRWEAQEGEMRQEGEQQIQEEERQAFISSLLAQKVGLFEL
jgi:hypothetical protein